jgi:hypothetical protein
MVGVMVEGVKMSKKAAIPPEIKTEVGLGLQKDHF